MARRSKSSGKSSEPRGDGLELAYPSSPRRPPIEVTRLWYGPEDDGGYAQPRAIVPWGAEFAVAHYVKMAIELLGEPDKDSTEKELCWLKRKLRLTSDGKPISYYVDLEMSTAQATWVPNVTDRQHFLPVRVRPPKDEDGASEEKESPSAPARERTPRPARTEGAIGVGALAEEAGLDPRDARKALRSAFPDRAKGQPWEWAPDHPDLRVVRDVLNKAVQDAKKRK